MNTVIIGGGPAGMSAAYHAALGGAQVVLLERNPKVGRKLYITGKGRCNITNDVSKDMLLKYVVNNPKFLFGALNFFPPERTVALMEENGCKVKIERGGRVFPADDKSASVIDALRYACLNSGVKIRNNLRVTEATTRPSGGFTLVTSDGDNITCDKLIVATGGISYPGTGSTGDGYKIAGSFGHRIISPVAALCPVVTIEDVSSLMGLSLNNVRLTAEYDGKVVASEFGDMLFTDKGLSGPIVLSVSSYINRLDKSKLKLTVDLKPALTAEKLDERILRDFGAAANKQFKNTLGGLLPKTLIQYIIDLSGIEPCKHINLVTRAERLNLTALLKGLAFRVKELEKIDAAIVTSGGVDTGEINPSTMESRLAKGLYFCGEVIDVDALTGGYNIQIALSTGALAGAKSCKF